MLKAIITNKTTLSNIPDWFKRVLMERLTFKNPRWIENEKYGYWQGDTDEWLYFYEFRDEGLVIPRGFIRQLIYLCRKHNVEYHLVDNRRTLPKVEFQFNGRLLQYLGRVLRPAPGKDKARVFDYVDINVGVLEAAAKGRHKVYM